MIDRVVAAGVLVYNNGLILGILRSDNNKWGLPFGKVEDNEIPMETAVRETLEETGRVVTLVDNVIPFISHDDLGAVCATFFAVEHEIYQGRVPSHANEGEARKLSIAHWLEENSSPKYNRAMLAHFGIPT